MIPSKLGVRRLSQAAILCGAPSSSPDPAPSLKYCSCASRRGESLLDNTLYPRLEARSLCTESTASLLSAVIMEGAEQVVVNIPEILPSEPPQAVPPVGTPASDPDFLTALHQACFTGQLEEVARLLETNLSLLFQSPNEEHGLTALHLAASGGHRRVAEQLLTASRAREANLETTATAQFVRVADRLGRTALHHAARNGHASVVELLLGAPEAADLALVKDGVRQSTAFLLAAMMPGDHVDTVRLLLEHDPLQIHAKVDDPQLGVADLKTLMRAELVHKADEASLRPEFSTGDYTVTEEEDDADRLRGRGVSIAGHTALHLAASQDNVQVMAYLLKHPDVDVNAIDDNFGMTPLHCAVRTGALRVMKTLLRLPMDKLDVNAQLLSLGDFPPRVEAAAPTEEEEEKIPYPLKVLAEGDTALHLAIKFGSRVQALETAELLCRLRHLTPSIRNKSLTRETALDLALQRWWASKIARWSRYENLEVLLAPQRLVDAIADHPDVQTEVNRVKQQEQGLQSTLNALLVGATLMAGITFQGFLQPPFGSAFQSYHPRVVKWFWVCNSLSFYFAIHTLLITLHALLPAGSINPPLAQSLGGMQSTRLSMQMLSSTVAMVVSTLTGMGAFATAGFANLSPGMYGVMLPTFIVGAILIISSGLLILRRGVWSLMNGLAGQADRVVYYDEPPSKGVLFFLFVLLALSPYSAWRQISREPKGQICTRQCATILIDLVQSYL